MSWADKEPSSGKIDGGNKDSCSETEGETKSEDEEDYTPVPHGTMSPKVVPSARWMNL